MNTDTLLAEIADAGWTVSWAFQFEPNHWRASLHRQEGRENVFNCCADAPTLPLALEYALINGEQVQSPITEPTHSSDPTSKPTIIDPRQLLLDLGIKAVVEPIRRRI